MTQETIVAAFDTVDAAQAAARAVEAAGISASAISHHGATSTMGATSLEPSHHERGFWARLFGTEDDNYAHPGTTGRDQEVYSRTISGGGTVLSVTVENVERDGDRILDILEAHDPIDLEERASSYDATGVGTYDATGTTGGLAATGLAEAPASFGGTAGTEQTIPLAEEALVVGKRVVNRGTTRIRRYVVETPVSEDVSLHRETVSVDRRPVTTSTVAADAFTDKTIEVTEMNEEAVVGKTARVVEEVVIRKNADDRVETVRDTVRREEVEIEKTSDDLTHGTTH